MPITDSKNLTTTHVGEVLYTQVRTDRIMSDVYADVTYAVVWDTATSSPVHIRLYDSEFGGDLSAQVDATPTILAEFASWEADQMIKKQAQETAEQEARAMDRVLAIRVGATVMALHGRKVPKGSVGVASRLDMNGTRMCFTDSVSGVQTWSDTSNFGRIDRCLPDGKTWSEYENDLQMSDTRVDFNKGDRVRIKLSGQTGMIFWKKDSRFGITPGQVRNPSTGQYTDALWASASELEHAP